MPLCHCIELPAKRFPLQMEFPSAGHEKKPFSMKMCTDPRKKQLLQMLGLLTLFFINNPQDLAYLLSTLEGKGYKAYNDILGENLISYNIIIIWGPQGRTHADQGHNARFIWHEFSVTQVNQGAKKIIFKACHLGKLKLAFPSQISFQLAPKLFD